MNRLRRERISEVIGLIGEPYLSEATLYTGKQKRTRRFGRVKWACAACLGLAVLAGAGGWMLHGRSGQTESGSQKYSVAVENATMCWPREYQTAYEEYPVMTYDGAQYRARNETVSEALLGETLGSCEASGEDVYADAEYTDTLDVYAIKGLSPARLVAVEIDGAYYVYLCNDPNAPSTLGELLDTCLSSETLEFTVFSAIGTEEGTGTRLLSDDTFLWQTLAECRGAEAVADDSWEIGERAYISLAVTSEALGVYKRVFQITQDGYLRTNAFDFAYLYRIGTDAAQRIIRYAMENSTETESEPYERGVAGILTEIGDGYLLVDSSVLFDEPTRGTVYRVPTDDIRIRRCIEFEGIGVGDLVVVTFRGTVDAENGNTVTGARDMVRGKLVSDGTVAVPE